MSSSGMRWIVARVGTKFNSAEFGPASGHYGPERAICLLTVPTSLETFTAGPSAACPLHAQLLRTIADLW